MVYITHILLLYYLKPFFTRDESDEETQNEPRQARFLPRMTTIYLIRHAEAEGNLYRRIQGRYDGALTAMGHRQAEFLRDRFLADPPDAVWSSDQTRAIQTATPLAEALRLPLRTDAGLEEVAMGDWEDRCWGWASRFDPEQYRALNRNPALWTVPGCEPYEETKKRMLGTVQRIAALHPDGRVAVFSHGSAIRILQAALLGYPPEETAKVPYCDNTAITVLEAGDGTVRLRSLNDNTHLPPEFSAFSTDEWWKNEDAQDGRDLYFLPLDVQSAEGGEEYLRCYREAWIASHGTDIGFSPVYLQKARSTASVTPEAVLQVFREEAPCGIVEFSPHAGAAEGYGHITLLYLDRNCRGRGLGIQLIGEAVSFYRRLGRTELRLRVAESNENALRFYRRHGFTVSATELGALGLIYVMTRPISLVM